MAAPRKIEHLSTQERKERGTRLEEGRLREPRRVEAGRGPARPGGAARGAERHPRAGPGAGPSRADDGLAVHVLPGRGQDHGGRPEGHADGRASTSSSAVTRTCRTSALFASPERQLLFDLNDFDETLPGPFEYDVKRMAASFTIAARNNGFTKADARAVTLASVQAYREAMARVRPDAHDGHLVRPPGPRKTLMASRSRRPRGRGDGARRQKAEPKRGKKKAAKKAAARRTPATACRRLSKLAELVDGTYRIVSQPPDRRPRT